MAAICEASSKFTTIYPPALAVHSGKVGGFSFQFYQQLLHLFAELLRIAEHGIPPLNGNMELEQIVHGYLLV